MSHLKVGSEAYDDDVIFLWQHVKSDHERQRELYQSGGSSEWDSGKKWGQGIPQGGTVNKNEVILINQGACGAFVQSLEDEYMGMWWSGLIWALRKYIHTPL